MIYFKMVFADIVLKLCNREIALWCNVYCSLACNWIIIALILCLYSLQFFFEQFGITAISENVMSICFACAPSISKYFSVLYFTCIFWSSVLMAPPKKKGLPKPLPEGFILADTEKKKWKLGKIIGQGGFGLIYLGTHPVHSHSVTYCM